MALRISNNQSAMAASMIRSPTNNKKAARRYSGSVTIVTIRRRRAVMSPPSIETLQISHQVIAPSPADLARRRRPLACGFGAERNEQFSPVVGTTDDDNCGHIFLTRWEKRQWQR
jgi:hypothetical protein